jgi:hypothetical protein
MNLDMGTRTNVVGKLTLGIPMEGNDVIDDIIHIEKPHVLGMVVEEPIPLMDDKEEVKETPSITLGDRGTSPPMLYETLMPNIG